MAQLVYAAGECAGCAEASDLYFMTALESKRVFCVCPGCGRAYSRPPRHGASPSSVERAEAYAPEGFRHATQAELQRAGLLRHVYRVDTELEAALFDGIPGYSAVLGSAAV